MRKVELSNLEEYPSFTQRVQERQRKSRPLNRSVSREKGYPKPLQKINAVLQRERESHSKSVQQTHATQLLAKRKAEKLSEVPAPGQYEVKGCFEQIVEKAFEKGRDT